MQLAMLSLCALSLGSASAWQSVMTPATRYSLARPPRAASLMADMSADFSAQLLKMPRLLDPQRASYEGYRERKKAEAAKNRRSGVVSTEEINEDSSEPPYPEPRGEATPSPLAMPIPYDLEFDLCDDEEEDAYEVGEISEQATNAADNYLNSL
ncbi:hypothetical protein T492DRAFT_1037184 [Pavlovales sp. CCMP2436]|nr:hypothetical protein T492DRAFT_1037184 [Pavlovales sp. CCMP2436]|mmetsp:Transcript_29611/g.74490  ORF Transcript_29611/g.74490 Transcript_29611/m.74490 type:complete len:154 (+) Transcript_29611:51-512(+)